MRFPFNDFDLEAIQKYWKQNIVPKHREDNKVNVIEWVAALKKLDSLSGVDDCERIFYYIFFNGESSGEEMKCTNFVEFVAVTDFVETKCSIPR